MGNKGVFLFFKQTAEYLNLQTQTQAVAGKRSFFECLLVEAKASLLKPWLSASILD